jgi:hypothetical protein
MSRFADDTSGKSLERRLGEWLNSQGYPLEMRVARRFEEAGFSCGVSQFFRDPETAEVRETDVMAFQAESYTDIDVRLTFVVECKSSRTRPWVFFVSGPNAWADINTHFLFTIASKQGRRLLNAVKRRDKVWDRLPLFTMPIRPGYGATQGFTSGKDVVYEAGISVVKAAIARAKEADVVSEEWPTAEIVFPIIVTPAPLFEYYLGPEGQPVLSEMTRALFVWRNPSVGRYVSLIFVIRDDALVEFAQAAAMSAQYLVHQCQAEVESLGKQWHAARDRGSTGGSGVPQSNPP